MALVIPPGFCQVLHLFSLTGDPETMAITYGDSMAGHTSPGDAALDNRDAWVTTVGVAANNSDQYTYRGTVVRVGQDGGPPVIAESPINLPGTAAGDVVLPQNCALLIRKQSTLGGRSGRGRMYMPPSRLYENLVDSRGVIGGSTLSSLQGAFTALLAAVPGMCLLHDSTAPTTVPTPITGLVVDQRIATQRRRLRP